MPSMSRNDVALVVHDWEKDGGNQELKIGFVLLAMWMVYKSRVILSTNQIQQWYLLRLRNPRFPAL